MLFLLLLQWPPAVGCVERMIYILLMEIKIISASYVAQIYLLLHHP